MTLIKVWHATHGPAHVAAHSSVREYAPRRAAVRAALSVLLLVLVLLSSPTGALAASNPSVVWQSGTNYVVSPTSNGFDAALAAIGLYSVRPRLTTDMLAKLSNESTGGDFYDLAQKFQSVASAEPPWLSSNGSDFVNNATAYGITATQCRLYGRDNVMWSDSVTSTDISNARSDFNVIQNGGSLGGGVGDGGGSFGNSFVVYPNYQFNGVNTSGYVSATSGSEVYKTLMSDDGSPYPSAQGTTVHLFSSPITVTLPDSYELPQLPDGFTTDDVYFTYAPHNRNLQIFLCDNASVSSTVRTITSRTGVTKSFTWYGGTFTPSKSITIVLSDSGLSYSSSTITATSLTTAPVVWSNYTSAVRWRDTDATCHGVGLSDTGSGGGGEVINRWPQDQITGHPIDEPEVPTPPEYDPITYTNPTDDPLPTPPPETPYTPTTPIVTTDPTNTTPQDYTPWLSAILTELRNFHLDAVGLGNNIIDALATHCTHITTTIMDETEWLYNQLKAQIRAGVQAILNGLDQNCTEMMNYLEDLAQWLADQLQFTFNIDNSYNPEISVPAYDDGSVIAWLQRIYNAIRSIKGPTIGTPVIEKDIEDGFDWWAWLLSLLDQLFDNVISQTVGEVESFLDEFRDLFPLSIPWDMVAILTMYAGTPTTPEVTLTFPAIASLGLPEYDLEIDLEPFDNAAYTIRQAEQIVFAFYLLFKTQWLLDTLKSATDAAGEFVEGLLT